MGLSRYFRGFPPISQQFSQTRKKPPRILREVEGREAGPPDASHVSRADGPDPFLVEIIRLINRAGAATPKRKAYEDPGNRARDLGKAYSSPVSDASRAASILATFAAAAALCASLTGALYETSFMGHSKYPV